jgi:hypothetical protein
VKLKNVQEAYWQTFIRLLLENKTAEEIRLDRLRWSSMYQGGWVAQNQEENKKEKSGLCRTNERKVCV